MKRALIVEEYGSFLSLQGDKLLVRAHGVVIETILVSELAHIILFGEHTAISTAAIFACTARDIPIFVLDTLGRPRAMLTAPTMLTVRFLQSKQEQFAKQSVALRFVCDILQEKIARQQAVLHYHVRSGRVRQKNISLPEESTQKYTCKLKQIRQQQKSITQVGQTLFLIEARAAQVYWKGLATLLPETFQFPGRRGRYAHDPFNKLLNYGYARLVSVVLRELFFARVDPSIGLLHHRAGAAYPLVYDFMEPFRPLIDHAVLSFVHRQRRDLLDRRGELRQSVLRRFRTHWQKAMRRPEPWSRRKESLEALVKNLVQDFIIKLGA